MPSCSVHEAAKCKFPKVCNFTRSNSSPIYRAAFTLHRRLKHCIRYMRYSVSNVGKRQPLQMSLTSLVCHTTIVVSDIVIIRGSSLKLIDVRSKLLGRCVSPIFFSLPSCVCFELSCCCTSAARLRFVYLGSVVGLRQPCSARERVCCWT